MIYHSQNLSLTSNTVYQLILLSITPKNVAFFKNKNKWQKWQNQPIQKIDYEYIRFFYLTNFTYYKVNCHLLPKTQKLLPNLFTLLHIVYILFHNSLHTFQIHRLTDKSLICSISMAWGVAPSFTYLPFFPSFIFGMTIVI
jgi:hypothetical protein